MSKQKVEIKPGDLCKKSRIEGHAADCKHPRAVAARRKTQKEPRP